MSTVQSPLPGLVVHEQPLVLKVSEDPVLLLVDGFLSPQECADVRDLGGPLLKRSKVSAGGLAPMGSGGAGRLCRVHVSRFASGMRAALLGGVWWCRAAV